MSTVDVVERSIRTRMLRGDLAPGTRLRQDEVAAEMGVSKIPVREALQRLASAGLLAFESNRGAVVPGLHADDAVEHFALRRAIEPLLLERSIPRMSVVDLAEAELALDGQTASPTEANWAFHRALSQASGWQRGLAIAEVLHASVAPYVRLYTEQLGGAAESDEEHVQLLEACRARNTEQAVNVLLNHLDHAESALVSFLAANDETTDVR